MNLQKAVKVACAMRETSQIELAKNIGVNESALCTSLKNKTMKFKNIIKMAEYFNLKTSEFIALGETK